MNRKKGSCGRKDRGTAERCPDSCVQVRMQKSSEAGLQVFVEYLLWARQCPQRLLGLSSEQKSLPLWSVDI